MKNGKISKIMKRNALIGMKREPEKMLSARVPESSHVKLMRKLKNNGHTLVDFILACVEAYLGEDENEKNPRH